MKHIMVCASCGAFTLKNVCSCGAATTTPRPARYSSDDKYARYRRESKETARKKEGLLA